MWCAVTQALTMRFIPALGGEYLHERKCTCTPTYDIYPLPLVHRPKGVLPAHIPCQFCDCSEGVYWPKKEVYMRKKIV